MKEILGFALIIIAIAVVFAHRPTTAELQQEHQIKQQLLSDDLDAEQSALNTARRRLQLKSN